MANRLADATSPYLLQHADNPVDWWEWSPEAFAEAKRRNVPILMSVGYAACHWCHVMAHESFEDDRTAALMNERFVNVKVDREERPDVDAVYMTATQAMTGHGGWPMTVFLTPTGEPFFCGTYFPDQPRHGQPAFTQILTAIAEAWRDRREELTSMGDRVSAHLQAAAATSGEVGAAQLAAAVTTLRGEYDAVSAGFGRSPKFPPSMVLDFLLLHHARTGAADALEMATGTLEAMARGGLYDQLSGGFARYSVDRDWVVPHFEKMLYDNAQLIGVYARWWAATGEPLGLRIARETAAFLIDQLGTPQGGFASALDADSDGAEGTFYVWSQADLAVVLGDEDGPWAAHLLRVTPDGTFEHGRSTLQLREDPDDPARWSRVQQLLLAERAARTRPARDDKVVAAWNGLAIASLAELGALTGEAAYLDAARRAARLLRDVHLTDGFRRVSRDGVAGRHAAVLEDYGCVAAGFLALAQATGEAEWYDAGVRLCDEALERFAAGDGGFYDTSVDAETLVARPRDPSDNASPSGQSALVGALLTSAALSGNGRHRDAAEAGLRTVHRLADQAPRFAGWSLAQAERALVGPIEIVVAGEGSELLTTARRVPGAVVLAAGDWAPLAQNRPQVGGVPTAYVCRSGLCRLPVTDVEGLTAAIRAAYE